jgi:hypothetical protein
LQVPTETPEKEKRIEEIHENVIFWNFFFLNSLFLFSRFGQIRPKGPDSQAEAGSVQ